MSKQFIFLAGLPRSGSTLFTSILNQNPNIFASSSSPVCNMLYWSSELYKVGKAIEANPNPKAVQAVLSSIIPSFYSTRPEPIIIDKGFSWGTPENLAVLTNALGYTPKFIVMDRPFPEIKNSYKKLLSKSPNFHGDIEKEHLELPIISHENLINNYSKHCFVVSYDRLCKDTSNLLIEFYNFIEQPYFQHDLLHIVNTCTDDDGVWGLTDMHKIKPTIEVR